ncbi:MAG TPA: ABC transporter substrate-binding protein [Chloroflexota bacterium]|nr:ABC transporter substrate-binding protein [Chloroflexota bacterium]
MTRWSLILTLCLAAACSSVAPGAAPPPNSAGSQSAPSSPAAVAAPTAPSAPPGAPSLAGDHATGAPAASGTNPYLPAPGEAPVNVNAATCAVTGGFVQFYTALDNGIFQKYGMNVQHTVIRSSGAALAAMTSGEIQFLYCAAAAVIPGMASGIEAKIVADPLQGLPYVMIARPDVHTMTDLRGKSLAITRPGDLDDLVSRQALEHFGLKPNEDVQLRPIGGSQPERYQALLANIVQGIAITPPLDAQARKDGMNVIYQLSDLNVPFVYSAVEAPNRVIRENPQLVQRFVAAIAEGVYFTEKNPEVARASLRKVLDLDDPEALDSAYDAYARKLVNRRMTTAFEAVNDIIQEARADGTAVTVSGAADIATNQFTDDLERTGFLQQLWGAELPPR